jgi:transcriptional regulator with XRE-family HTH domain
MILKPLPGSAVERIRMERRRAGLFQRVVARWHRFDSKAPAPERGQPEEEIPASFGQRLRAERKRLGLTQACFADVAGVSKSGLVKWEKDSSRPNAAHLVSYAAAGVDVMFLLTGLRGSPEQIEQVRAAAAAEVSGAQREQQQPDLQQFPHHHHHHP